MEQRIIIARQALEVIGRAPGKAALPSSSASQPVGGILIGKRLDPNRISIVAASEPGPQPDNDQLGFALDLNHANATLQEWFTRDPDVDLVGVWHTHPAGASQPGPRDLQAAQGLREQTGSTEGNVILALVGAAPSHDIHLFHLTSAEPAASAVLVPVPYEVLDQAVPVAPAEEISPAAVAAPTARDAVSRAAGARTTAVTPWWRKPVPAGAALLLTVLLLGGLWRALGAGGEAAGTAGVDPAGVAAGTAGADSAGVAVVATVTEESSPVAVVVTEAPTAVAAPPTPTREPTASLTASPTTPPATTPGPVATEQAQETALSSPTASLPYTLQVQPMATTARTAFLARQRAAACAGCFNVDIVGPTPFEELRIQIEGVDRPPLRNFAVPSLASLAPRPEPYTLRALDLEGNPAAPPITVDVDEDEYYVLTISRAQP